MIIYMESTLAFITKANPDKVGKLIASGEVKSIKDDQIKYLKII